MKVYTHGEREQNVTLHVTPGADRAGIETSAFYTDENVPILFTVRFRNGCAEVIDELGKFLIDKGIAKSSPIILPDARIALPA